MSLKDIRSECTDVAALLQPYVDSELNDQEQEPVAAHLQECSGCRAAVSEQAWVRATLHQVERETAPQALRARLLVGLDEVDREWKAEAAAAAPPGLAARMWSRLKDLGRGGLIMVPAAAAAAGLFVVVQQGAVPTDEAPATAAGRGLGSAILSGAEAGLQAEPDTKADPPKSDDDDLVRAIAELQPQVAFPVQVPQRSESGNGLQLVRASLDRQDDQAGARLRYQLPGGQHLIDRQLPAQAFAPRGTQHQRLGRSYHLHRNDAGQAMLFFKLGGVGHVMVLEGGSAGPDELGAVTPDRPDYDLLLKFAARLDRP